MLCYKLRFGTCSLSNSQLNMLSQRRSRLLASIKNSLKCQKVCFIFVQICIFLTGKLSKDHMQKMFLNLFPNGDTLPFINSIYRMFSSKRKDENLNFTEFLMAMNVTTITSEEEKLKVTCDVTHLNKTHKDEFYFHSVVYNQCTNKQPK